MICWWRFDRPDVADEVPLLLSVINDKPWSR